MKRRRAVLAWLAAASFALAAGCNGLAGIHDPIEPLDAGGGEPDGGDDAVAPPEDAPIDDAPISVPPPAPCTGPCAPTPASAATFVQSVALDPSGATAYFTSQVPPAIYAVSPDAADAAAPRKVADLTSTPYGLAVTSSRIYWIGYTGASSAVYSRAIGADAAAPIDQLSPLLYGPTGGIAAKDEIVYVSDSGGAQGSGTVWRIDGLAAIAYGPCSRSFAVAADHGGAFVMDDGGTDIVGFQGSKANADPPVLADFTGGVGLAVNDTTVFFTTGGASGAVRSFQKLGAPSPRYLATDQSDASAIATDANGDVYWGSSGALATNAGGFTHVIATPAATPTSIAAAPRRVLFVAGGALWTIAKP